MTETEHREYLESDEYRAWSALRQRVLAGETLSGDEVTRYAAIADRLDREEAATFLGEAARTRDDLSDLEAENRRLRERYENLKEQLARLEERLTERTRSLSASTVAGPS